MSNKFIKKQLDFIVTNMGMTDIYEIDKIRYGLELFYGEFSKLIVMILVSLILDKFSAFCINDYLINANKALYWRKSC